MKRSNQPSLAYVGQWTKKYKASPDEQYNRSVWASYFAPSATRLNNIDVDLMAKKEYKSVDVAHLLTALKLLPLAARVWYEYLSKQYV